MNSSVHVYIPQQPLKNRGPRQVPAMNLTPAEAFGTLLTLLPGDPLVDPVTVIPALRAALIDSNYIASRDYLLPVGSPVIISWTAAIMTALGDGNLNVLRWDTIDRKYYATAIRTHETKDIIPIDINTKAEPYNQKELVHG